jgi:hypothetical protein
VRRSHHSSVLLHGLHQVRAGNRRPAGATRRAARNLHAAWRDLHDLAAFRRHTGPICGGEGYGHRPTRLRTRRSYPAYGRCCVPLSRALDRRGPAARGADRAPDSSTVSQPSLASDDDESSASPVLWETLPRAPLLLKCPLLVIGAGDCSGALGGLASVESPPALRPRPRPLLLLLALAGCDVVEPRPGRILFATTASSSTECVEPTSMRSARRNKSTYKKLEVVGGTTEKARTFECGVLIVVPHGSGAHSEEHDQHDRCDT